LVVRDRVHLDDSRVAPGARVLGLAAMSSETRAQLTARREGSELPVE
jgi:hypothetical protein